MCLCMINQTVFGEMLQQLVELTSILLRSEPLDNEIERRYKHAWEQVRCPDCGETVINAGDSSAPENLLRNSIQNIVIE